MSEVSPIELIVFAAEKLQELRQQVVFLGGAVVGLLVTEEGGIPLRATKDVDVLVEIATRIDYYRIDKRLRELGFSNDVNGPVCRYQHGMVMLDVMPTDPEALGFANRWYPEAMQSAGQMTLPQGIEINLISSPCFLATKLEAFGDPEREGHDDIFVSRDFGDVIRVIDGRPSLVNEVLTASVELRTYLQERFADLMRERYLEEAILEHVDPGREDMVVERIRALAADDRD